MRANLTQTQRNHVEAEIERLIALLDAMDDDCDLEDDETEGNGDELDADGNEGDFSGYQEEFPTSDWTGSGHAVALGMLWSYPAAARRVAQFAAEPSRPLVYDFRGYR